MQTYTKKDLKQAFMAGRIFGQRTMDVSGEIFQTMEALFLIELIKQIDEDKVAKDKISSQN